MRSRFFIQIVLLLGICFGKSSAFAQQRQTGFLNLPSGHAVYFDFVRPAPGQPILVLINGLTYETTSWDPFVKRVYSPGMGLLRYDPAGMGQTLLKYAPIKAEIPINSQVMDLKFLLDGLGIHQRVNLLGLSYGGALAIIFTAHFPGYVENCILMAPFVGPLKAQQDWIRQQIAITRIMYPMNTATDDQLGVYFFRNLAYATMPAAEPSVLKNPYKLESVIEMTLGSRFYTAQPYAPALAGSRIHLIMAGKDQYIPHPDHENFWQAVPASSRVSLMLLDGSEHKIPEAFPKFSAAWVRLIMANDPRVAHGSVFEGMPSSGVAKSSSVQIAMPQE